MEVTYELKNEITGLATKYGLNPKDLMEHVLTVLEALAQEPEGTQLAFYNPKTDKIETLPFPDTSKPPPKPPKLRVVSG